MLRRLQEFLKSRRQACLADIAVALQADEQAVLGMLELLERRGRVERIVMNERLCGACARCHPARRIEWRWRG